ECDQCHDSEEQYCRHGMTPTYGAPDRIDGEITQGGYSKHIVVREEFVLRIPDALDMSRAAPILCAGITTFSPLRTWNIGKGSRVGVIGLGGLGHMAVKLAVAMGAEVTVLSRSKKKEEDYKGLKEVYFANANEEKVLIGKVLAQAQNFTRDLVNTPPNEINPETFAQIAEEIAEEYGFEVDIKDPCWVEKEMPGLWAVGKGSKTKPRFIHLIYKPQGGAKKKIAFVGKGLTFDSGGLNIKPEQFMKTMKMDKSGACAVLGIFKALGELKKLGLAPQNVEIHGFVGAAENMPGGESYRPDDIIRMRNGKTVEVANTDAEGRITLGDVLTYTSEQSPDYIVDMATLTGACVVALGEYTAGLFGNDEEFINTYLEISKKTGERMWQLPLDDELLREEIKSDVADISNLGKSRYGGAITAAMFLQEFVGEKDGKPIPWIHIDIAGPAWARKPYKWNPQSGGTGFGVRTAVEFVLSQDKNS
ncbi:MAG: hypothetical protein DSZ31_01895, partial [Gammaproteobacteria bacterium]